MNRQNHTGNLTESLVRSELQRRGLDAVKPVPDHGVDFLVSCASQTTKKLKIQVKGRGRIQTNMRYRWFQIRTTKRQREEAMAEGIELCDSWRVKVRLAEFFMALD